MIDENSYYLSLYEEQQDLLEKKYYQNLPAVREDIVAYAKEVLFGEVVDDDLYHQVFGKYWCDDREEYQPYILAVVDDWADGEDLPQEDLDVLYSLAVEALKVSAEALENVPLHELCSDGMWNVNELIQEVIG